MSRIARLLSAGELLEVSSRYCPACLVGVSPDHRRCPVCGVRLVAERPGQHRSQISPGSQELPEFDPDSYETADGPAEEPPAPGGGFVRRLIFGILFAILVAAVRFLTDR